MRVVIVGAGHAGTDAATSLREHGFGGEVVLVSDEDVLPYHRPPLSKQLMRRDAPQLLLPESAYVDQGVDLRRGDRVVRIDRNTRLLTLASSEEIGYDALVLATGARPRRLGLTGLPESGLFELRDWGQSRGLAAAVATASSIAVVGGGLIGLEVASSARMYGLEVTVVEQQDHAVGRVASRELGSYLEDLHRSLGVEILTSTGVRRIESDGDGRGCYVVHLDRGASVRADVVLVAIGAEPRVELAAEIGIDCDGGVLVHDLCRTSDPAIFAIGDVTRRAVPGSDGARRLESIPSAQEQARALTAILLDQPLPEPEVPWFWSDQFDHHIQIAGMVSEHSVPVRLENGQGHLVLLHRAGVGIGAVEAVDAPAEFAAARQLIESGSHVDLEALVGCEPEALRDLAAPTAVEVSGASASPLVSVTYVDLDGVERIGSLRPGQTLMDGALEAGVEGMIGECGGLATCSTCHIYVADGWEDKIPEADAFELETLDLAVDIRPNSRLGCQIVAGPEIDGLVVSVPKEQA